MTSPLLLEAAALTLILAPVVLGAYLLVVGAIERRRSARRMARHYWQTVAAYRRSLRKDGTYRPGHTYEQWSNDTTGDRS
jgi:hypothetical protein